MRKKTSLFIIVILFTTFVFAQKDSLYVSIDGGKSSFMGHLKYNYFHFQHHSNQCDTLICHDPGYEQCKISKNYFIFDSTESNHYKIFNKAIQKTIKYIKKHQTESGDFTETILKREVHVQFFNANKNGEGIFLIQIIE
ncbi:MAG: hypothetical protein H6Q25_863 [Bacteroidetes bacterium]|nr:hypothetical protein [Bacteroidota bacterium]